MRPSKLYFILIFSLHLLLSAQSGPVIIKIKKSTDTIDYKYIDHFGGYTLVKVTDKETVLRHNCSKTLWFTYDLDSHFIKIAKARNEQIGKSDTLINLKWYFSKTLNCVSETCGHDDFIWKLSVNKKSNILVTDRVFCLKDKVLTHLLFKVIKFSESEIILEDLQIKPLRRLYYFKGNNPKN